MREVKLVTRYILYNDDVHVAEFSVHSSVITEFTPQRPELLPKQIRQASADGFAFRLGERAVDLNSVKTFLKNTRFSTSGTSIPVSSISTEIAIWGIFFGSENSSIAL